MTTLQALVLGVVQGITEYLPVSSSAHLVLVPELLNWHYTPSQSFIFDVLVQLGTLVGVVIYYRQDLSDVAISMFEGISSKQPLKSPNARLGWLLVLATIPAATIGFLFKSHLEQFFSSPKAAMIFLILTAALLMFGEFLGSRTRNTVRAPDALRMGFAQALALFPGVSRSGSTISIGMASGLSRESAARFSFLMSIPIMIGASAVAMKDFAYSPEISASFFVPLVVGFFAAAISGYFVIRWFLHYLKSQSLMWFALYCALVGSTGLLLTT